MGKPEKIFKAGAVRAAIFRNVNSKSTPSVSSQSKAHQFKHSTGVPKVILEVRYRDAQGQWHGTPSLSLNEIPKAIAVLQSAYAYLLEHRTPD